MQFPPSGLQSRRRPAVVLARHAGPLPGLHVAYFQPASRHHWPFDLLASVPSLQPLPCPKAKVTCFRLFALDLIIILLPASHFSISLFPLHNKPPQNNGEFCWSELSWTLFLCGNPSCVRGECGRQPGLSGQEEPRLAWLSPLCVVSRAPAGRPSPCVAERSGDAAGGPRDKAPTTRGWTRHVEDPSGHTRVEKRPLLRRQSARPHS